MDITESIDRLHFIQSEMMDLLLEIRAVLRDLPSWAGIPIGGPGWIDEILVRLTNDHQVPDQAIPETMDDMILTLITANNAEAKIIDEE